MIKKISYTVINLLFNITLKLLQKNICLHVKEHLIQKISFIVITAKNLLYNIIFKLLQKKFVYKLNYLFLTCKSSWFFSEYRSNYKVLFP